MGINCILSILGTEVESIEELAKKPGLIQKYIDEYVPKLIGFAIKLILAVIFLAIGIRIIKSLVKMINKSLKRSRMDISLVSFLTSFIKYFMYFILIMIILSCFGVTASSVVAILGSAGLTLGLALQGSLSNFAGGILILLIKPFGIGDFIIVKDKDVEGTVADITLFYTKLKTVDNKMIMIPNGGLSGACIINVSYMDRRRVEVKVGVSYDADIAKTKDILMRIAMEQPALLKDEPVDVFVDELGDSAVNYLIGVKCKQGSEYAVRRAILTLVKDAYDKNNIKIPYNQIEVHNGSKI